MPRTSAQTLRNWLLDALATLGGAATKREALDEIATQYGHLLTPDDKLVLNTRNEIKWENSVAWERSKLRDEGLVRADSKRDWWELTEVGIGAANLSREKRGLPPVGDSSHEETAKSAQLVPALKESLDEFKPKSAAEYRAKVQGAELVKSRHHESLVREYGKWAIKHGLKPATNCHPIDFKLKRGAIPVIGEAKIVYRGNATEAVRAASAQLLMYRFFLHTHGKCVMLALFNEPVGAAHVRFLTSLNIVSVWKSDGVWFGSARAFELGLASKKG